MLIMKLRIDKAGRVSFPKRLRERLGFKPERRIEVVEESGGVLLRVADRSPSLVRVGRLWVHQGKALPHANWERVLDEVREERIRRALED